GTRAVRRDVVPVTWWSHHDPRRDRIVQRDLLFHRGTAAGTGDSQRTGRAAAGPAEVVAGLRGQTGPGRRDRRQCDDRIFASVAGPVDRRPGVRRRVALANSGSANCRELGGLVASGVARQWGPLAA